MHESSSSRQAWACADGYWAVRCNRKRKRPGMRARDRRSVAAYRCWLGARGEGSSSKAQIAPDSSAPDPRPEPSPSPCRSGPQNIRGALGADPVRAHLGSAVRTHSNHFAGGQVRGRVLFGTAGRPVISATWPLRTSRTLFYDSLATSSTGMGRLPWLRHGPSRPRCWRRTELGEDCRSLVCRVD